MCNPVNSLAACTVYMKCQHLSVWYDTVFIDFHMTFGNFFPTTRAACRMQDEAWMCECYSMCLACNLVWLHFPLSFLYFYSPPWAGKGETQIALQTVFFALCAMFCNPILFFPPRIQPATCVFSESSSHFSFLSPCLSAADKEVEDYYTGKCHLPDLAARGTLPLHILKTSQEQVSIGFSHVTCSLMQFLLFICGKWSFPDFSLLEQKRGVKVRCIKKTIQYVYNFHSILIKTINLTFANHDQTLKSYWQTSITQP